VLAPAVDENGDAALVQVVEARTFEGESAGREVARGRGKIQAAGQP